MNATEHLLTCLSEECAEVSQRASKALRFGLDEVQPEQPFNNAQRIIAEVNDLIAVIEMLQQANALPRVTRAAVDEKKRKLAEWMRYSAERGALASPDPGS
jgi:uncharacterized protein (UPF0147 family)